MRQHKDSERLTRLDSVGESNSSKKKWRKIREHGGRHRESEKIEIRVQLGEQLLRTTLATCKSSCQVAPRAALFVWVAAFWP